MTDLEEMVDRIERATGPDRQLDAAIDQHVESWVSPRTGVHSDTGENFTFPSVPKYTASIDAAIALVERMFPKIAKRLHFAFDPDPVFGAELFLRTGQRFVGDAANMPLALIAAALRASLREKASG